MPVPRPLRRRRLLRRHAGTSGAAAPARRHRGRAGRRHRRLQDRPAQPRADGLLQAGRGVRPAQRHLRRRHAVVQHHDVDGTADAQHPALLRPVRARGHRRAHPRQVRGLAQEGHVDGRLRAARLRRQGPQAGRERGRGRDRSDRSSSGSPRSARQPRWCASSAAEGIAGPSAASSSTRATSTSCSTTGSTSGEAVHKGTAYPGEHEAIVDRALWDKVHSILQESPRQRAANTRSQTPALLKGFDLRADRHGDDAHHTRKRAVASTATTSRWT